MGEIGCVLSCIWIVNLIKNGFLIVFDQNTEGVKCSDNICMKEYIRG